VILYEYKIFIVKTDESMLYILVKYFFIKVYKIIYIYVSILKLLIKEKMNTFVTM